MIIKMQCGNVICLMNAQYSGYSTRKEERTFFNGNHFDHTTLSQNFPAEIIISQMTTNKPSTMMFPKLSYLMIATMFALGACIVHPTSATEAAAMVTTTNNNNVKESQDSSLRRHDILLCPVGTSIKFVPCTKTILCPVGYEVYLITGCGCGCRPKLCPLATTVSYVSTVYPCTKMIACPASSTQFAIPGCGCGCSPILLNSAAASTP